MSRQNEPAKRSGSPSSCCIGALALLAAPAAAQVGGWTQQTPKPTPFDMTDVQMLSPTEAFAVGSEFLGNFAAILHTTDGGATWDATYPATNDITAVFFLDGLRGWAVGHGFFHTVDGAATWIKDSSQGSISDVQFVDAQNGFACGNGGYTYRSTDGGLTWSFTTLPDITTLSSVFFHDAQRGWTLSVNGKLWKTSDGGVTWSLFIGSSTSYNPTYLDIIKWTFVPWPPDVVLAAVLDGTGSYSLTVPGGGGPLTIYLQAVAVSPFDYSGFATSNALQVEFLP